MLRFFLFLCFSYGALCQTNYRFSSDISIKDKLPNGKFRLTVGKVYYDKIYSKVVFKFRFPQVETNVMQDTSLFVFNEKNELTGRFSNMMVPEFTIFHLGLNNNLGSYGFNDGKNFYKVAKVEKEGNRVITTWMPGDAKLNKYLGRIVMANENKKLDAIAFYGPKGELLSKQFLKDYVTIKGVAFPTNVVQYSYSVKDKNKETIRQTTYKNIVIDQAGNDEIYRYKIPITKKK